MKKMLPLLFLSFPLFCFSQQYGMNNLLENNNSNSASNFNSRGKKSATVYRTNNLLLGYQNINFNSLNSFLFQGKTSGFSSNHLYYSYCTEIFPLSKNGNGITNILEFTYFNPQKISLPDTTYTLSGWQGHVVHFGFDAIPKNKNIDFSFFGGFEYGRLKLIREAISSGTKTTYTNPIFALNASTELHFNFFPFKNPEKGFGIGGCAGYNLDLSNSKWINKSGGPSGFPGTKLSGYNYSLLVVFYM
jgi:hypothetical protein